METLSLSCFTAARVYNFKVIELETCTLQRPVFFLTLFLRGRFGQVHKCVENSSGLTLAAKVIKARNQKEKVQHLTLSVMIINESYFDTYCENHTT